MVGIRTGGSITIAGVSRLKGGRVAVGSIRSGVNLGEVLVAVDSTGGSGVASEAAVQPETETTRDRNIRVSWA